MAIWKVKSQTAVTVELLGGLPQSDCDKMIGDLQADPPILVKAAEEAQVSRFSQARCGMSLVLGNSFL